jgi:hypothetical protein
VTPLYKKDDPTNPDNYWPIVVDFLTVHLFATVLNRHMSSYLESQCLRAEARAGFRARHSVSHNLFAFQHAIDKHSGRRGPPIVQLFRGSHCSRRKCADGGLVATTPFLGCTGLRRCRQTQNPCMLAPSWPSRWRAVWERPHIHTLGSGRAARRAPHCLGRSSMH